MAISLCSALLLVTLSQAPPVAPTDSLATLRGRAAQDSSDAQLWLLMGRAYLGLGVEAHGAGPAAVLGRGRGRAVRLRAQSQVRAPRPPPALGIGGSLRGAAAERGG